MFKNIFDKAKQKFNGLAESAKNATRATGGLMRAIPTRPEDRDMAWLKRGQQKRKAPSRRRFFYIGLDDKKHSVRIGKPFSVRPKLYPDMIIATFGNRDMIRVYA